jgi:hypothetical protein
VENSGYDFSEKLNIEKELYKNRFEIITFKESELKEAEYLVGNKSKGSSEIFAISYAFNNSKLITPSSFIIKITCRYYITDLEKYLENIDLNKYDCLTQNFRDRCEMVGSHFNNIKYIFNIDYSEFENTHHIKNLNHIESIWEYRTNKYKNILICPIFNIEKTQRGGINDYFTNI